MTSIDRQDGIFQVHIEEKNADQNNLERKKLLSKGFFPPITVQDFPLRGHQVFLPIKPRR
ncbi:ISAon1 family transposase N-terminal region protein [Spirosoma spitsbergense]|uniref:ISAon1 family transposase N-terminal region protein n=1 Tax=Spirosoma spitsbergense TaxID=431554 RepID=UPI003CCBF358